MDLTKEQRLILESFVQKNPILEDFKKQEIQKFLHQTENVVVSATTEIEIEAPMPSVESVVAKPRKKRTVRKLKESVSIAPDINAIVQLILHDQTFAWQLKEKFDLVGQKGESGLNGLNGKDGLPGPKGEDGLPGPKGEDGKSVETEAVINVLFENEDFIKRLQVLINQNSSNKWVLPGGGVGANEVRVIVGEYTNYHNFEELDTVIDEDELMIYDITTNTYKKVTYQNFIAGISGSGSNAGVSTLNALSGDVVLSGAGNNTISYVGNTIVITGSGGSGTVSGSYVRTIEGLSGDIDLSAGQNIGINKVGNTIVISAAGSLTSAGVETINNIEGDVIIAAGPNISLINSGQTITISASAVASFNSYFPSGW